MRGPREGQGRLFLLSCFPAPEQSRNEQSSPQSPPPTLEDENHQTRAFQSAAPPSAPHKAVGLVPVLLSRTRNDFRSEEKKCWYVTKFINSPGERGHDGFSASFLSRLKCHRSPALPDRPPPPVPLAKHTHPLEHLSSAVIVVRSHTFDPLTSPLGPEVGFQQSEEVTAQPPALAREFFLSHQPVLLDSVRLF